MDIISEGEGLFETGHAKNHRAENEGNVEWKALGKRSTLATATLGRDIDTAGLRTPISLDMKCGKVAPFLPSASSWHQGPLQRD